MMSSYFRSLVPAKKPRLSMRTGQKQKIVFRTTPVIIGSFLTCLVIGWIIFFNTVKVDRSMAKGTVLIQDQQYIVDMTLPAPIINPTPSNSESILFRQAKPLNEE